MKKAILIVIVVGAFGWAVFDFVSSSNDTTVEEDNDDGDRVTESDEIGLLKGQIAPDFELETLEGETVSLYDYRGKPVIVNFWATWCPPCRAEIPDLQKLYDKKDVEILAVNLTDTKNERENVGPFVEDFEMTFPVLLDEKSDVATAYQVMAYPTSYMIDSNGHIQFMAMGAMNYDLMAQELEKMD